MVPEKGLGQKGIDLKQNSPPCRIINFKISSLHIYVVTSINSDFLKY